MKFKDLQKKSAQDLQKALAEQRAHLRELRFKTANDQLKNVRDIRQTRKGIARILMLISDKARGQVDSQATAAQAKKEETNK